MARGLFFESGLYNNAPLENFIKSKFENLKIERKLNIGIVDIMEGSYKDFSE